jgi:hypothetical protein
MKLQKIGTDGFTRRSIKKEENIPSYNSPMY